MDEDSHQVDRDEDDDVGDDSLPLRHQVQLGVENHNTDDGVTTGEEETIGDSNPGPDIKKLF